MSTRQRSWRKFKWASLSVTATVLVFALVASLMGVIPGLPSWWRDDAPELQDMGDPVEGAAQEVLPTEPGAEEDAAVTEPGQVDWPSAATQTVPVTGQGSEPQRVEVGGLEVWATSSSDEVEQIQVDLLDQQAAQDNSVHGLVLRVSAAEGQADPDQVELSVDYSGIQNAYGGNYGSRLRLVDLGDNAQDVSSINNAPARTVTATITPGAGAADDRRAPSVSLPQEPVEPAATMLALEADPFSWEGDYTATELSPSAEWNVALSSGAFTWDYGLTVPPVPGGLEPKISLGYSSQTVDGRTSATNNQGSWIGEGFSYEGGYIERSYASCEDDGEETQKYDQCWATDNATLMLNGQSTELIRDDETGEWRPRNDDGSRIERLTGANNGDDDGEYWRVTTVEGIQYTFGLNRLPGWASGDPTTNAVWTVPVFGNDSGEPCHEADFSEAWCQQAWRWNLDHIEDTRGNIATFHYAKETNRYALNGDLDTAGTEYVRGGYLKRIDYGLREGEAYDRQAPAQVVFTTAERCLETDDFACDPDDLDEDTAKHWPDIPYDLHCAEGEECSRTQTSPSFWTQKRLSSIHTQILTDDGYSKVDSWELQHLFTDNGDGSSTLWLSELTRTGHVGGTQSLPPVRFNGIQLPNRIRETGDQISALVRFRLSNIYTETGGQITVNYSGSDCTPADLPEEGESTDRCYPVIWHPPGFEDPVTDWFHKYVVTELILTDRTGGSEEQVTRYDYLGDAAWRHAEEDGITPEEYLTWSQWRGYETVRVTRGDGQEMPAMTEHTLLRGMHGDESPDGGTRSVSVTDSTGEEHTDRDEFAGTTLETATYDGDQLVSRTISEPWRHRTATQTEDWGTRHATIVEAGTQRNLAELSSGGTRESRTTTTYDTTTGRPLQVDEAGDIAVDGDERCRKYTYADNTSQHLLNFPARDLLLAGPCGSTTVSADTVLTDMRTFYDGQGFGEAPTQANVTRTEQVTDFVDGAAVYSLIEASEHDTYGRVTKVTHPGGVVARRMTRTDENGLSLHYQVENALGHTIDVHYDPHRGSHLWEQDANGRKIETAYDPLGRRTQIWHPDRDRSRDQSPSLRFEYQFADDAPVAVKGEELTNDGSYDTSYTLYDGFLRQRQIQKPGTDGGRLVTDAFYNGIGEKRLENDSYYALGSPAPEVLTVTNGDVNGQNLYVYDGAGRVSDEIRRVAGQEVWRTTYSYGGDRVLTTPPEGGTPVTTVSDVRDNVVARTQHTGSADEDLTTRYTYTLRNELTSVVSPTGARWSNEYDYRGNIVSQTDPDSGQVSMEYDERGLLTATVDARDVRLTRAYDDLQRQTSLIEGDAATGTPLVTLEYDTRLKGHLFMETRHHQGRDYRTAVTERDTMYRPTKTVIGIPDGHGELTGNYTFTTSYNQDGTVREHGYPAVGGLPAESVTVGYDELQRPTTLTGQDTYVTRTDYAQTGELLQVELTTGQGPTSWITYEHEKGTQRLLNARIDRQGQDALADHRYTYNDAGNIVSLANVPTNSAPEVQCYDYDALSRLVDAWSTAGTSHDSCATEPSTAQVGGPVPYWTSYTYDASGNRLEEVEHAVGQGAATDTVRDYTYPTVEQGRPHTLASVTESAPEGDTLFTYDYDEAGNTTQRVEAADEYTFAWDAQGRLSSAQSPTGTTSFVYSSQNETLIKETPEENTLYLPGMEVSQNVLTDEVQAARYYSHGGTMVAMRDTSGVTFFGADHHGTANAAINAADNQNWIRRFTPFGSERGEEQQWPDDKGFLGKTVDESLGIIHVGAREYDPLTGRFLSDDPIMDFEDSQQINGYAYANNTPVAASDPSGLMLAGCHCSSGTVPSGGGTSSNSGGGSGSSGGGGGGGGGGGAPVWIPGNMGGPIVGSISSVSAYPMTTNQYNEFFAHLVETDSGYVLSADTNLSDMSAFQAGNLLAIMHDTDTGMMDPQDRIDAIIAAELVMFASGIDINSAEFKSGYDAFFNIQEAAELGYVAFGGMSAGSGAAGVGARSLVRTTSCRNSFIEGTLVLLADGTYKPIEDLTIGDEVLATDPETGEEGPRPVVATIIGQGNKTLFDIAIDSSTERDSPGGEVLGGNSFQVDVEETGVPGPVTVGDVITATDGHPFWVPGLSTWVDAIDLAPGMWLQTSAGAWVQIKALERRTQSTAVYNLAIQGIHTYYVLAGDSPVLVHNSGPCSQWASRYERIGDVVENYTEGQKTRDPSSQWYHEYLTNDELISGTNNANLGDAIAVTPGGTLVGGHHRWDELGLRINRGRIDPNTLIRVDVYLGE
ncbi:type IV secretion protein Rhs [Nocardiopsis akebiae]|uniref:Type IV secretion protein Rhs n=1 Tax=Nocardiopsis akebiae TaxID=2831968 RepID=A0ABX8C6Q4_9ACTN|nr:RHS repeat-associated core domain-containing protein [Nocardiopsis akebiae]QUX29575.1 type IV secretion protein Rhs [Nocardiopsis akebiae]